MTTRKSPENGEPISEHLTDLEKLTKTELREKYKLTYDSWRNRKAKAKPDNNWHPDFDDFRDFLRFIGPRPSSEHTLDRIANSNPMYGPGLVRWANKSEQANNRSSNVPVYYNGVRTLTEAARASGQSPDTVRKRRDRGWSDIEALNNYRDPPLLDFGKDPRTYQPWPGDVSQKGKWELLFLKSGGAKNWDDRYAFLLSFLGEIVAPFERAKVEYGPLDEEDYQSWPEYTPKVQRAINLLKLKKKEYGNWLSAMRVFEARSFEENRLKQQFKRPFSPRSEDDEDRS